MSCSTPMVALPPRVCAPAGMAQANAAKAARASPARGRLSDGMRKSPRWPRGYWRTGYTLPGRRTTPSCAAMPGAGALRRLWLGLRATRMDTPMRDGASASLDRFLAPAAIAIVGASPDITKIRGRLLHLLRENGYTGHLYPVNPNYREIDGLRCFPSVGAIGAPVDLALVAIPAETVLPSLEECAAAGVGHAVIISSGFAEQGGGEARPPGG